MACPIENKLVVAVASSALFDLSESDKIYKEQGLDARVLCSTTSRSEAALRTHAVSTMSPRPGSIPVDSCRLP